MKLNEISCYADNLLRTRTQCEEQAQESLLNSDEHARHITNLETKEKNLINQLHQTAQQSSILQHDLSLKSHALSNILNPRNPIAPTPTKKYAGHHMFSYNKDSIVNAHKEYEYELEKRAYKFSHHKNRLNASSYK